LRQRPNCDAAAGCDRDADRNTTTDCYTNGSAPRRDTASHGNTDGDAGADGDPRHFIRGEVGAVDLRLSG
jgi:hypothetical protein